MKSVFDEVLTIGPDLRCIGGIASVLQNYARNLPSFTHCASNSHRGTALGVLALARLLMLMPVYKLRGYKIVHVHGATGKSWVRKRLILHWARVLGFKTIFHCHGGSFADYADRVGVEKIRKELERCTAVVTLSRRWSEVFAERLGFEWARHIENIVELPSFEHQAELHEPLTALFVGKICAEKGLYDLVEALNIKYDYFEGRLRVIIAGVGEVGPFMDAVRRAGLEQIVEYIGPVYGQQKEEAFGRADFVLLPSHYEGMPLCILEGAVRGLPSVATPVGGVPEFIEDGVNGRLVAIKAPQQLAEVLADYVENPGQIKVQGEAAKESVRCHLPQAVVDSLAALYRDVISK